MFLAAHTAAVQALAAQPSTPASVLAQLASLQQQAAAARQASDNAWILTCSVLVLLMTAPGLALFYGGLVRKKNVLGTMLQSFAMMALVTVVWALFGFSLVFAPGHGWLGGFLGGSAHLFLRGVGAAPNPAYAASLPFASFMVFQLMFAIITPALISGAFAERMKFGAMALFMTLWSLVVYCPVAHMVWGQGGWLNVNGGRLPVLDFAGGTVVHVTSGVSALVCCLYLGQRVGHGEEPMEPHNMVLSIIGASMLWVGWFGFNAGSALTAGSLATTAFVATQMAPAAAAIVWSGAEWLRSRKVSALGAISGAVAGLVAVTPAAGYIGPMAALAIGAAAGLICYLMVNIVKARLGYDDSLDAFGIHGVGGLVGALLTGVFALSSFDPVLHGAHGQVLPLGWIEGNFHQIVNQAIGVAVAGGLAVVGTLALLKLVDAVVGLRVSTEHEQLGLDLSQHGEEGYRWQTVA